MKKFENLGRSLSKQEQKRIMGGDESEDGGACYYVYSDQGYSSCWFTLGSEIALCERVYPGHCDHVSHAVDCNLNNCIMN